MKNFLKYIFIFFLITNFTFCQNMTLGSAINKAGRQRMLSQRMAKDYLLIGAEVRIE